MTTDYYARRQFTHENKSGFNISTIWLSLARLVATIGIFVFHYIKLLGFSGYYLDILAILIFCFLSGYLINIKKTVKPKWLIERYLKIMIPFWLVIFPVFIANQAFQYKTNISLLTCVITVICGNMFLKESLYVIAWYITFVLLLYIYAFAESFCRSWKKWVFMIIGIIIFFFMPVNTCYFLSFLAGLRLSEHCFVVWPKESDSFLGRTASGFIVVQRYCYSFFLIHGAVLLFFFKKTDVPPTGIFLSSVFISSTLSVIIYNVSIKLNASAMNKIPRKH